MTMLERYVHGYHDQESARLSQSSVMRAAHRVAVAGLGNVDVVVADVYDLPQADTVLGPSAFDHVFVCFLLEQMATIWMSR